MKSSILGAMGEQIAAEYLRKKKYDILELRYHSRFGEIDIIAKKKNIIVFIEVKTRKNDNFAKAFENVDGKKQDKIRITASLWTSQNDKNYDYRFDVIEVYTEKNIVNHIENAF